MRDHSDLVRFIGVALVLGFVLLAPSLAHAPAPTPTWALKLARILTDTGTATSTRLGVGLDAYLHSDRLSRKPPDSEEYIHLYIAVKPRSGGIEFHAGERLVKHTSVDLRQEKNRLTVRIQLENPETTREEAQQFSRIVNLVLAAHSEIGL